VDREPLIRIYQALPDAAKPVADAITDDSSAMDPAAAAKKKKAVTASASKVKFVRRGVADWKGVLVAYEVVEWFKGLADGPYGPLKGRRIKWATDDALTAEINAFKASKAHTGAEPEKIVTTNSPTFDPLGYHKDIEAALMLGLVDDVFGTHTKILSGRRLETLVHFLEVASHTFPDRAMRLRLGQLRDALASREAWLQPACVGTCALKKYNQSTQAWHIEIFIVRACD